MQQKLSRTSFLVPTANWEAARKLAFDHHVSLGKIFRAALTEYLDCEVRKIPRVRHLGINIVRDNESVMALPRHDWDMADFDAESKCYFAPEALSGHDTKDIRREYVELADLPPGTVPEDDSNDHSWEAKFSPDSIYPPIVAKFDPKDGTYSITMGNHRVRMWRKFGFTHAPAFVWESCAS